MRGREQVQGAAGELGRRIGVSHHAMRRGPHQATTVSRQSRQGKIVDIVPSLE